MKEILLYTVLLLLLLLQLQLLRMYEYNEHNESLFSGAVGAAQHINTTT